MNCVCILVIYCCMKKHILYANNQDYYMQFKIDCPSCHFSWLTQIWNSLDNNTSVITKYEYFNETNNGNFILCMFKQGIYFNNAYRLYISAKLEIKYILTIKIVSKKISNFQTEILNVSFKKNGKDCLNDYYIFMLQFFCYIFYLRN